VLRRCTIGLFSGLLIVGLLPPAADARRKPTKGERTAILRALHGTNRFSCQGYPAGSCKEVVRVSTARKGWSAVYISPTKGNENTVQSDVASLKRRNGRWRVHQIGNGGGCGVPRAVARDLKLACY
jgi:hypothetical protein